MLEKEFKYFTAHQRELFEIYPNRFLVIQREGVLGDFSDFDSAFVWATEQLTLGTFIIQECTGSEESYTQTFHSRVRFA